MLDASFAILAFVVIETLHTQISSLFLGKDGTALAYQVSGDYMRWLGYFFIFMGIKMATDGVLRGLGIMRPFLVPTLLGYIDKTKKQMIINEARDVWVASQAALTECYGLHPESFEASCKFTSSIGGRTVKNLGIINDRMAARRIIRLYYLCV